ncbi:MAG: translation elongation factor-like protein [Candidatus Micrarchaeota archaeon]|nr:translation elongation factor-like protein [Candidatus Micrarchaeota archaeon]
MDDLDNVMDVLDAMEAKKKGESLAQPAAGRTLVGEVEHFFESINVAGVRLSGRLAVGDTVEIENDEYTVRQRVSSMQINRKDVSEASAGDDVGVKVGVPVKRGSSVFRL